MNLVELDASYENVEQYDQLTICSNLLINTSHILQDSEGWSPFVLRKGNKPRVWLSAQIQDSEGNKSKVQLITDSKVVFDRITLDISEFGFEIKLDNQIIARAGNHTEKSLEVIYIDFRPLGLDVHGENESLTMGGMTMSRNTSKNANVMFGF